jgi:phage baseplate assembly protein W
MATDFGTTFSCTSDIDLTRRVSGIRVVGEALARRLSTPRGSLINASDYGYDLRQLLNESLDQAGINRVQMSIAAECEKDERVLSAVAECRFDFAASKLTVAVGVTTAQAPFTLVLSVDALTVQILRVQ